MFPSHDPGGNPLSGGEVYTYAAGTLTPLATYKSKAEFAQNTNPIILDANGQADIWITNAAYRIIVKDSDGNTLYDIDNVQHINDSAILTAMIADEAVTTDKIADGNVTRDKLATTIGRIGSHTTKTANYTIRNTDDIVFANAISGDFTLTLPAKRISAGRMITVKRIDETDIKEQTFVDGDVTVGTDTINISSHGFIDLQKVQLTTSGTLPAGLSLSTDYWIIYVDADNIQLASSLENAQSDTPVDITAASGGGTHRCTNEETLVTIDGYQDETIDGALTKPLYEQYDFYRFYCDGSKWQIVEYKEKPPFLELTDGSGNFSTASAAFVTNIEKTVQLKGRKLVELFLAPDPDQASNVSYIGVSGGATTDRQLRFRFQYENKETTAFFGNRRIRNAGASGNLALYLPPGCVSVIVEPPQGRGIYTFSLQLQSGTSYLYYSIMGVREI